MKSRKSIRKFRVSREAAKFRVSLAGIAKVKLMATPYFCREIENQRIMSNRTFTMIKPDAMKKGHAGAILDQIIKAGFRIVALKQTKLSSEKAGEFYAVHKSRPFYGELVQFMSSGLIIAAILEKDNAVADFRTLIGA